MFCRALEKREEAGILAGMEHVNEHPSFSELADPVSHQRVDSAIAYVDSAIACSNILQAVCLAEALEI